MVSFLAWFLANTVFLSQWPVSLLYQFFTSHQHYAACIYNRKLLNIMWDVLLCNWVPVYQPHDTISQKTVIVKVEIGGIDGKNREIKNCMPMSKQATTYDCMCKFLNCVYLCMLPFMKVTICDINESCPKGAAPLQAVKCNTAYSFKLPSPRWKV